MIIGVILTGCEQQPVSNTIVDKSESNSLITASLVTTNITDNNTENETECNIAIPQITLSSN